MSFFEKIGLFQYGKIIPGLEINGKVANYPVVNEIAIRIQAAIMFVLGSTAVYLSYFHAEYLMLKMVVLLFFIDFFCKVFLGFNWSILLTIGNLIAKVAKPKYVGAVQKRFAWFVGFIMSSVMVFLLFALDMSGQVLPRLICGLCLSLMLLEFALGYCLGCQIYYALINSGLIKAPKVAPACSDGLCYIEPRVNNTEQ